MQLEINRKVTLHDRSLASPAIRLLIHLSVYPIIYFVCPVSASGSPPCWPCQIYLLWVTHEVICTRYLGHVEFEMTHVIVSKRSAGALPTTGILSPFPGARSGSCACRWAHGEPVWPGEVWRGNMWCLGLANLKAGAWCSACQAEEWCWYLLRAKSHFHLLFCVAFSAAKIKLVGCAAATGKVRVFQWCLKLITDEKYGIEVIEIVTV